MSPEQLDDVLDCGTPEANFHTLVKHWRERAAQANEIAADLRREAEDAQERAAEFREAARDFEALATALVQARITFPANKAETPK